MSGRVQASTSPTVQVVTTPDLDSALARNRFRSLAHLLEPFLSQPGLERIQTRTPATYDQVTHDHFPVRLVSADLPAASVDWLLDQVAQDIAANVSEWLNGEETTPWYDAVRDAVLARRDLARDLDSFDSPLATLVALSTAHPDPLNALAALWDQHPADRLRFILLVHDHGHPDADADWTDAQKLHDTIRKTYGLHTQLVPLFSAAPTAPQPEPPAPDAALAIWNWGDDATPPSTALVGLGVDETGGGQGDDDAKESPAARAPSSHPPAAELSTRDLTALATFSREFVVQSLVPFLERTAIVAHEQWIASRRSLGGRLFSVGRKYFGGGGGGGGSGTGGGSAGQGGAEGGSRAASPGPAGGREGYNPAKGVYHPHSQLSQTRRLADLCLVLGDPKLAHAVYESLAKDYRADKAWRHAAAATRMAGLASLLVYSSSAAVVEGSSSGGGGGPSPLGSPNNNPDAYLVAASSLSQLAPSPADYDALRATLLYYEMYRSLAPYAKRSACWSLASDALVRTAGEADEVVSAVLLEQAALADWKAPVGILGGTTGGGGGLKAGKEGEIRGRRRKYAFHLAMAAARYEKCGIKALSRRCLGQAATLFQPLPPSVSIKPYHPESVAANAANAEGAEDSAPPPPPLTALLDPRFPPPPRPRDSSETLSLMPWLAIRTYMHHSLARQAYTVGDALDAVEHFLELLVGSAAAAMMDPTAMTTAAGAAAETTTLTLSAGDWLDDFALAYSLLGDDADRLVSERGIHLPIRLFDAQNAKLAEPGAASAASHAQGAPAVTLAWDELEQDMLQRAQWQETTTTRKKRPRTISHRISRTSESPTASGAAATAKASWVAPPPFEAAVGETVMLEVPVRNPLEAFLALGDVKVEIETTDLEGKVGSTEAHATMDVELAPLERSKVYIPIRATTLGKLVVRSISYRFSGLLPVSESLAERWTTPTPARPGKPSVRNRIPLVADVHAPTPRVEVDLSALPSKLFHGEMRAVTVTFRNTGKTPITELHFLCSHPEVVSTLAPGAESAGDSREVSNGIDTPPPVSLLPSARALQPGDSVQQELIVRGDAAGRRNLQFLLAFCGDLDSEVYAATGVHVLDVYPSLNVRCRARTTFAGDNPFLLDIDVHNCGLPADDVTIEGIAMFSPTWRCDAGSTSWVRPGNPGWQQSTAFSVAVAGAEPVADEIDVEFVKRVQTVLQGRDPPTSPYPRIVLLRSSIGSTDGSNENLLALYAASRRSRVSDLFAMIPRDRHARLFPLFFSRAAFLAVRVTSTTLDLAGPKAATVIVPLDAPAIGSSAGSAGALALQKALTTAQGFAGGLYEETQRERTTLLGALGSMELLTSAASSPIQLDMQVNINVEHDFANGPLFLPVRFCLRNTSPVASTTFSLELAGVSSHSAAPFIGALRHEGRLDPLALHVVEVQVWLSRPGTYVVGNGQLAVSTPDAAGSTWRIRLPARALRVRTPPQVIEAVSSGSAQPLVDVRA